VARKTKEDSEKTRQAILDGAEAVFLCRGMGMATMADIADAAEVSRGAVYGHFKNKQEVAIAMANRGFQELVDLIPPLSAPYLDRIEDIFMMFLQRCSKGSSGERVLEILYLKCEQQEENAELIRRRDLFDRGCKHLTRKILRKAHKNGELPENVDIDLVNISLHALFHGVSGTLIWMRKSDEVEWDRIHQLLSCWRDSLHRCNQYQQRKR